MDGECAVCFETGPTRRTPCCGARATETSVQLCTACMTDMVHRGTCPVCNVRIDTRQAARTWTAAAAAQYRATRFTPDPLPAQTPSKRRKQNASRAKRTPRQKNTPRGSNRATTAEGEQLHLSERNTTGYTGVVKEHGTAKYRAEIGGSCIGTYPTAMKAAAAYARVKRRREHEVVPTARPGPRDITLDRQPRVYA